MRVRGIHFQQLLLGAALLAALCWNLARASEINDLRVNAGPTGTRAELLLDKQAAFQVISLANPDRLVVDLPDTELSRKLKLPAPAGLVKAVRSGHPVAGTTRIVFDLAGPVVALKPRFEDGPGGARLILEWPGDSGGDAIARIVGAGSAATAAAERDDAGADDAPTAAEPEHEPDPDPAATSAAATSRLVAATVQASAPAPSPANSTSPSQSARDPLSTQPIPAATVTQAPGTIATGVPTRIATGVPTRIATGVPTALPSSADAEAATPAASAPASSAQRPWVRNSVLRGGMRPLVVAIDPGHGGQDPGAIGPTGKREKDVTLAIGRELARQINASPGLKAYMTRDTDVFIPLNRRAQLARAAKADIFVSIHADAAENRGANGSSVYVLSLKGASSQRARWLADKENSADLIGGRLPVADNTLASVLLDLTQSGHMKASEDAAGHVLSGLGRVGSHHKSSIERANFAVLRTSDMPAMLVETAFISNPDEERRLTSADYQRDLARAVLGGIDAYFVQQPPPGTMYAARAQAGGAMGGGSP